MVSISSEDLLTMINDSVDTALTKNNIPDTARSRIDILTGMYQIISKEGIVDSNDRMILQTMEDEIIRLTDLSV